jgi:uncharacterized paraquat-inducible protein A
MPRMRGTIFAASSKLLAFTALCPRCQSRLVQAGRRMRDGLVATFVASMAMAFRLEDRLSTSFTDDEVLGVRFQRALQPWLGLASFASAESLGRFAWLLVPRSWNLDAVGSFHFCIVRTPTRS